MDKERSETTQSLLVRSGETEKQYVLGVRQVVLGRDRNCDVTLEEPCASGRHARLALDGPQGTIQDLNSRNGTFVNMKRLSGQPRVLTDNDRIMIGKTEIRYLAPQPECRTGVEGTLGGTLSADDLSTAMLSGTIGATLAADSTASLSLPAAEHGLLRIIVTASDAPRMVFREEGTTEEQALGSDPITIGRDRKSDIRLRDALASRHHAKIEPCNRGYRIRDLGSRNRIRVNGIEVDEHQMVEGDTIRIGTAVLVFKQGKGTSGPATFGSDRRPVVLIPGFGGSELWSGKTQLWPNLQKLMTQNDPSDYWGEVSVRGILREISIVPGLFKMESFGSIVDFLVDELGYQPQRNLLEFAYDWRQDVRASAQLLKVAVRQWRTTRPTPADRVTIIAHSMGGLVTRYYLQQLDGSEAVERAIFMGTPHRGSTSALALALAGKGVLPFNLPLSSVKSVVSGFPSLYQLLPDYAAAELVDGREFAPLADDGWLPAKQRRHLETALEFRRELEASTRQLSIPHTSIFGYGQNTLARLRLNCNKRGTITLNQTFFESSGDAAVLEHSAVLDHSDIHPVRQQHGALYADHDVQRRLRFELLERPPA